MHLSRSVRRNAICFYCGTLPVAQVREEIEASLPLKEITVAVNAPSHRDAKKYDKPTVYFMDMPTASQSIVYGYAKER